jgi:hypothetical protein
MVPPIVTLTRIHKSIPVANPCLNGKAVLSAKTMPLMAWHGILKHSVAIFAKIALIT